MERESNFFLSFFFLFLFLSYIILCKLPNCRPKDRCRHWSGEEDSSLSVLNFSRSSCRTIGNRWSGARLLEDSPAPREPGSFQCYPIRSTWRLQRGSYRDTARKRWKRKDSTRMAVPLASMQYHTGLHSWITRQNSIHSIFRIVIVCG